MKNFFALLCLQFAIIIFPSNKITAQGLDNIWTFGWEAGLDFTTSPPAPFTISGFNSYEGCASVCDTSGQLLFYTEGENVYDQNQNLMPNGSLLAPAWSAKSTTQGTVILPVPDSINLYYIFSLQDQAMSGKLYYSLVDMNLNGGLGDVVAGRKSILLDDDLTEKMTIAPGSCGNSWLVVRSRAQNEYKSYSISREGSINTSPISSTVGNVPLAAYTAGTIKFSPDNKKMVAAVMGGHGAGAASYLEMYDFDTHSGAITNAVILDTMFVVTGGSYFGTDSGRYYSVCFSPDGSKLYGALHFTNQIKQFDLSQPNIAAIRASKTTIVNICANPWSNYYCTSPGDMKIGPDGKLYIAAFERSYLACISYPNLAGAACGYADNAISLLAVTSGTLGLPSRILNRTRNKNPGDTVSSLTEITACAETTLTSPRESDAYLWNTAATEAKITITTPGVYWVQTFGACEVNLDSFVVHFIDPPVLNLGPDRTICDGEHVILSPTIPVPEPFTFNWSTGSPANAISVSDPGLYWLKVSFPPCMSIDSISINTKDCDCILQIPSAFSPNGDGINDVFAPIMSPGCQNIENYSFYIFNRWGQLVFNSFKTLKAWDGTYNNQTADAGVYFFLLHYEDQQNQQVSRKGDIVLIR